LEKLIERLRVRVPSGTVLLDRSAGLVLMKEVLVARSRLDGDAGALHAVVLVLGRLEQSPRMLAHATALARAGFRVTLAGYGTADVSHPRIEVVSLSSEAPVSVHAATMRTRRWTARVLYFSRAVGVLLGRFRQALCCLERVPAWDLLIIQNPPAFPTFFLALWFRWKCARRHALTFIDWHNTTHSIMKLNRAPDMAVGIASRLEYRLGKAIADAHLSVTATLQTCLQDAMQLSAGRFLVLPDRPMRTWIDQWQQQTTNVAARSALRRAWCGRVLQCSDAALERMVSEPWLCSATSWTSDEPMELLFEAVGILEREYGWSGHLFITGRGPLRSQYVETIWPKLGLRQWQLHALWLPSRAEYAQLLACADVGVSMHISSSGMDLPMKVFDMWACGLPVAAFSYPCLDRELPLARIAIETRTETIPTEDMMGRSFIDLSGLVRAILKLKEHEEAYRSNIRRKCAADSGWQWESQYEQQFLPFWHRIQKAASANSLSAETCTPLEL
jgi:beta-1,4-mannosyltransferase